MDFQELKNHTASTPVFVIDEAKLTENLTLVASLCRRSGGKFLYAVKALPFAPVLATAQPFVDGFSVSSLFEARLARETLTDGRTLHLTTPGLKPDEFDELTSLCSHISFNSLSQFQRYGSTGKPGASFGLRVNPKLSFLQDDRFDPCRKHSKLGADIDDLWQSSCFGQIRGLHIHNVFSAVDYQPLIQTINKLRRYFGRNLAGLDWLNLGGGYLFDLIGNHAPLIELVRELKNDFGLDVYLEPGKAIVDNAGHLVATVLDRFVSDGKTVAVLDTSVNHHPEIFEYQRRPDLHEHDDNGRYPVILAGSTCLAGDLFGEYRLASPPTIGDKVVFKQLGAYSLIKANRFNGYNLPDIAVYRDRQLITIKRYNYQDYRRQWLAD